MVDLGRWAAMAISATMLLSGCGQPQTRQPYEASWVSDRYLLWIRATDVSEETIGFKMEGVRFAVPVNYLSKILESDPDGQAELNSGFAMRLTLPHLQPRDRENRSAFATTLGSMDIFVQRVCGRQSFTGCVPTRGMEIARLVYGGELAPPLHLLPTLAVPNGLRLAGHGRFRGSDGPYDSDIYETIASDELGTFIVCQRPGAVPVPHCTQFAYWRSRILVKLFYRIEHLPRWQELQRETLALLEDFSREGHVPDHMFPPSNQPPPGAVVRRVYF
jgi:hypothetical protein